MRAKCEHYIVPGGSHYHIEGSTVWRSGCVIARTAGHRSALIFLHETIIIELTERARVAREKLLQLDMTLAAFAHKPVDLARFRDREGEKDCATPVNRRGDGAPSAQRRALAAD